ncbi:hypothetical protein JW949_02085 [Candidatus Woesearchaeota archaeon]|nr:hypothetical protein [Candidatus Woesearchaeota archaeon]
MSYKLGNNIVGLDGYLLNSSTIENIIDQSIPVSWKLKFEINKKNQNIIEIKSYLPSGDYPLIRIKYNNKRVEIYPLNPLFKSKSKDLENKIYEKLK